MEVGPMRMLKPLWVVGLAAGLAIGLLLSMTGTALAAGTKVCVPAAAETAIMTPPTSGTCKTGYTETTLLPKAEQEKLEKVLPYIKYEEKGIDSKPTIQFSGVNLQVIDGSGLETTLNGTGNLILGYDETPGAQTGSHNLLLGGTDNSYTSYGGIVGGAHSNKISNGYASVLGGSENTASGYASAILGGRSNKASINLATVSGGCSNLAGTGTLAVNSACTTTDAGYFASVLGGVGNQASAENATVSGGYIDKASGAASSVSGGASNDSSGEYSSISGGEFNEAHGSRSWVGGGFYNKASATVASVTANTTPPAKARHR
jgi:hypothetical protein